MAVREQRQLLAAASEPTLSWLRLFVIAVTGMAVIATGAIKGATAYDQSAVWVVLVLAAAYAAADSGLSLYRRYRRLLSRRVYVVVDLALITLLVYLTGGVESPLYLLYALPLVVVVLQHGLRAGGYYSLTVTALYAGIALASESTTLAWLVHLGLLWGMYLLLGYAAYVEDDHDERARRRDELGAMHRVAAAPMHTGDLCTVSEKILSSALGATNSCWAAIFLYDEQDDTFTTRYSLAHPDRDGEVAQSWPRVTASDVLYTVLYTGQSTAIGDIHADKRLRSSVLHQERIRSVILTPMVAPGGKKVGIFCLGRGECHRATQHELRFSGTLALQAAIAIHTAELFEEAANVKAAKEADKLRSQLLATVSHELRTPIAAIQGFASSLRCAGELEVPKEMTDDWIDEIELNAERLRRLVTDLLDLSRLEAGALQMKMEWHEFNDVLDDLRPSLAMLARERNFVIQSTDTLPLVRCDGERIGQVLTNLVENAVKFSPAGSNLVIGAERMEGGLRVGVLDEGEGIPPEFQEKVFERFYQVEGAAFRAQKGTGLGLAICRNIVEAHGGSIWVESSPGKGSIFYFTLPSAAGVN